MDTATETEDVVLTADNMNRYAALLKFQIEADLGHMIKDSQCYATIKNGEATIMLDVPGWNVQ